MLSAAAGRVDPSDASQFVQNALDGMARYGSGSIDLWTATFKVLDVMGDGPSTVVAALPTTLFMGSESAGHWMQAGYKVSSNVLGWARFGYTCLVKIVVTITQNVLLNVPVGPGRAWRIVVNTLDEMRDHYESDVVDNIRQSCAGISLMMGLTNPWAVFVYQQCVAANTAVEAGVDVALSVFNLAPFAQCMCTGTAGKVFGDYAMAYCVPQASTSLRPVLLQMIQASSATPVGNALPQSQALCQDMINYTKAQLVAAVQPWFDAQFASMNALGASLDYTISWLDPTAGECLAYGQDPDVVVIMPYPVDYFQACGGTSLCRAKCNGTWADFEASLSGAAPSTQTSTVYVESLFFPTLSADRLNPMTIWALLEPPGSICVRVCGGTSGGVVNSCVAVAGTKEPGRRAVLLHPHAAHRNVYRTMDPSLEWVFPGSYAWADLVAMVSPGALIRGCWASPSPSRTTPSSATSARPRTSPRTSSPSSPRPSTTPCRSPTRRCSTCRGARRRAPAWLLVPRRRGSWCVACAGAHQPARARTKSLRGSW